ncbi:MAG: rRNA pseudouridine synthase [Butyrivibrio sp.]|nr:rRNA pseudouridine synthase [Butyrivibrio sp.]
MKLRIDKFLADMGRGSRSEIKEYIRKGLVSVNGAAVKSPSEKADTEHDEVMLDGIKIEYAVFEYYILNKPAGVITATEDSREKTVLDLIDSRRSGLFPVGRLDRDTEGLLLITNDGQLAHELLSPRRHVDKTYFVRADGRLTAEHAGLIADGLRVDGEFTALPAKLEITKSGEVSEAFLTVHEGKFHQVKRMMEACGCKVTYLKRTAMGGLKLPKELAAGEYRALTPEELFDLKKKL